jgi:hypothetical protein
LINHLAVKTAATSSTESRSVRRSIHSLDELQADLDAWLVEYNYVDHIRAGGASARALSAH